MQTFTTTGGATVAIAVGVNIGTAVICGTGEGVSVAIKTDGVGAGEVGVGSVETEKLHPVKRNNPIDTADIILMFMAVSSS